MIHPSSLLLFVLALLPHIPAQDYSLPSAQYRHQIIYSTEDLLDPAVLATTGSRLSSERVFLPAGNLLRRPALRSVDLFTPNTVQQPAETPGQMENYRKALEEEAREAERAENAITTAVFRGRIGGGGGRRPKSYVSVKVGSGSKRYDYGYTF